MGINGSQISLYFSIFSSCYYTHLKVLDYKTVTPEINLLRVRVSKEKLKHVDAGDIKYV